MSQINPPGPPLGQPISTLPAELAHRIAQFSDEESLLQLRAVSRQIAHLTRNEYINRHFKHRRVVISHPRSLITELAVARSPMVGTQVRYLSLFMGRHATQGQNAVIYPRNELFAIFQEYTRQNRNVALVLTDEHSNSFIPGVSEETDMNLYWDPTGARRAMIVITGALQFNFSHDIPLDVIQRELDRSGFPITTFVEQRSTITAGHLLQLPANEHANWQRSLAQATFISVRIHGGSRAARVPPQTLGSDSRPTHNMLAQLPALRSLTLASHSFRNGNNSVRGDTLPDLVFPFVQTLRLENWYISFDELVDFIKLQPALRELVLHKIKFCPGFGDQLEQVVAEEDTFESLLIRLTKVGDVSIGVTMDDGTVTWTSRVLEARLSKLRALR